MKKNWILKYKDNEEIISKIQEKYKLNRIASSILSHMDLNDKEIETFLSPTRGDFHDPFLMPDMEKAVDRIVEAINNKEKIIVYGDYDADGITSSSTLKRFFNSLEVEVGIYIPNRLNEGYGLNKKALDLIASEGYKLIITVDCGITAIEETEYAKKLGMDVIITDHHEPGEDIPNAIAVVDCKRKDNKYPFRELAGCGVAFKLTQAICKRLDISENEALRLLDITCIGTISDIVPLQDENRVITKLGMLLLKRTNLIGIRELLKTAGFKEINTTTISFGISPRINACGRMGHQEVALELFLTNDPIKARKLALEVEGYNKKRQEIEKKIYEDALEMIDENDKVIILGKENWHHGVIGIVSSKITEKYYKPSILVCFEGEDANGSGRSIEGFDLHEALLKCNKSLKNYGGHSMAVGLSLKTNKFNEFKEEFENYAKDLITEEMLISKIEIDEEVTSKDITIENIKELEKLEPFGEGNVEPIFLYRNLKISSIRTLSEGKHIKLSLIDENVVIDAIGFGMGEIANQYQIGDKVDIIGNIQINKFNNVEKIQILIKDLRKAI